MMKSMLYILTAPLCLLMACSTSEPVVQGATEQAQGRKSPTPTPVPAPTPTPTPAPSPTEGVGGPQSALVTAYGRWQGTEEKYDNLLYRPRQFVAGLSLDAGVTDYGKQVISNAGAFAGWDAVSLPNLYSVTLISEPEIVHLTLSRAARVGLIWRAGSWRPAWLGTWSSSGTVTVSRNGTPTTYPVFTKNFAAGQVSLQSVAIPGDAGTQNYSVIVGEQGGTPSPVPTVPAGQTVPQPNQACPAWVHDQYKVAGPDGVLYATWHPQIDPVYWCSFGHEHGSDPKLAGVNSTGKAIYSPLYGYTASRHGMTEPHEGFKTHVFKNTDGAWWAVTVHMGSSGMGRVCTRDHTFNLGVTSAGTLKADVHMMGDFGRARYFPATSVVANVTGCGVDQNTIRDMGSRTLGSPNTDGYEPWVVDNEYNVTGFHPDFFSVKQSFPITRCAVVPACTSLEDLRAVDPIHSGSERLLEYVSARVVAGDHGSNSGVFYTDPAGAKFVSATAPMSTRQFVAAGFRSTLTPPPNPTGYCTARDAWTEEFKCQATTFFTSDKNIENSLRSPN